MGNMPAPEATKAGKIELGSYDYMDMKKSLRKGTRRTLQLRPVSGDNNFAYGNNQVIMFDIPYLEGAFLDLKNTSMLFTATAGTPGTPGSTNTAFNNFIESVINRFQLFLADGTNEIETINYYNLKANALLKYKISDDYFNTIAHQQWGVADQATRLQWASSATGRDYAVNLIGSGFFSSPMVYIPLNLMAKANNYSRSMRLEITLEMPNICMFATVSTAIRNYFLSNVTLQMDYIQMNEYGAELKKKINSGSMNLTIPFCTSHTWPSTILAGQTGRQQISFQEYKQYMSGIMTVFTSTADYTQEYTNQFVFPNLTAYQYQINNEYYPLKEIALRANNGVSPSYNELIKYFNKVKKYDESTSGGILNNNAPFTLYVDTGQNMNTADTRADPLIPLAGDNGVTIQPSSYFIFDPDTGYFSVNQAGFYQLNLYVNVQGFNTVTNSNIFFSVEIFTVTAGPTYTSLTTSVYSDVVMPVIMGARVSETSPKENVSLVINQYLKPGIVYTIGAYLGNNNINDQAYISQFFLNAILVSSLPAGDSVDFVLATTLKTFFDQEEHLNNIDQYLLDGKEVRMSSVINLNIGTANANNVQMYNYVDYTAGVVIDSEKVMVVS